ncbi:Kinesin heavy chain [Phytophthora citrophthora]|uniref:Kinesin-like protein n=1 Tax=Phytophthora citrophthora TaxID=4793 RepID=A0AAD9G4Y6_9STRA|nr:Kinesin heavy chain [Phytophthora citrophthora]
MEKKMTATSSPSSSASSGGAPELASIKVFCRLRQQNQLEKREQAVQCTTVVGGRTMFLRNERCEVDEIRCTFDRVFDINSTQEEVYTYSAKPLVHEFLQGYNCTIFAYGQTGSGKTHTILGPKDGVLVSADEEGGIISRVAKDLYEEVGRAKTDPIELTVSFVEIYMEQIRDLLSSNSGGGSVGTPTNGGLKIRESAQHGVYIEEMTRIPSKSEAAMMELVKSGTLSRAVSSTRMNKDSSRSHTILMISCVRPVSGRRATMYIVDLAGSELVNKTNASGRVLQEAKAINKSLSALSNVIKALGDGKRHVPYRDSKLTRLLQDSLGGTAKTCLILAASCSSYNMPETISTLRFGLRAKEIKNPVIQRTDGSEGGAGFATGIIFKELYQRAMEDMEAKNRKIDELQRLLTAKYQENQHPDEPAVNELSTAATKDAGTLQDTDISDGDHSSQEGDNEEEEDGDSVDEDEDETDPAQTKLELVNQALGEENKRLFGVLEALEMKLDEVTVDLSTGRPILTLSSPLDKATESDSTGINEDSRETAAPSLKVWLESDNWRKSLESKQPDSPETSISSSTEVAKTTAMQVSTVQETKKADSPLKEAFTPTSLPSLQGSIPPCLAPDCVHHADAEALSRQLVELKLQLHYLSENARLSLGGEGYNIAVENVRLKTRIEELEFQANLCNVACSQLEMKNRACETRLSNQETHIGCLQNSLQEYQGLFKQQIVMSQEKCRLLTDELEFYKKLARCSQESYQHLGGGTSPGRRNKGKSPSPKKAASNVNRSSSVSLLGRDGAATSGPPPFGSLSNNPEFLLSPLTARAQRFIVKPTGERASSITDQPAATATKMTSIKDLSLSLDELAQSATLSASPVASPLV